MNRIVRIPIATSIKNVENPVVVISFSFRSRPSGRTRLSVFFFVKKWDSIARKLIDLSSAFRETSLALQVGKLFYSEQTVFPYNELGIGRLIYQLPVSICERFLEEIFGKEIPEAFDDETTATINRFFQNNLNIAETSRQLHMHRNTLIYRLEQIQKRTGLDLRTFEDAMTFKIATMVINYLHTERNQ